MNPIEPTIKTELLSIILIIIAVIFSFYFYFHFPDQVPIHWNIKGEPDNWGSPKLAAFLMPIVIIVMYLLFIVLPYIDPKKKRYAEFSKVYHVFKNILIFFMALIYFIASLNGLGYNIPVAVWMPLLVGVLFMIIGSYMGKIKPNWFIGIRTPWTLSSEAVWHKTHQVGGKLFIAGGILMILQIITPISWRLSLFIIIIAMILLGTVGYSYWLYRVEEKKLKGNSH